MSSKRERRPRRVLTGSIAFAAALAVSQCLVAHWCEPPACLSLEAKWADFERCADDVDIVFLGTSRVERHIDPRIVDRTLARHGMTTRSYNLGLPKLSALEGAEIIKRLAKRLPQRLKLVVLEPTLYIYDAENWATDRAMAQHDWSGTMRAIRLTWASESRRGTSYWGKLKCIAPHALSFLFRTSGLRRGAPLLTGFPASSSMSATATARGFAPLPVGSAQGVPGDWRERFRRFLQLDADWYGTELSSEELAFLDDLLDGIRQTGAEPVLLLGPKVKRDSHTAAVYTSRQERYTDVALLDYLRGHGRRQIYQLPYWHDFDHLNAAGAALFSRELAGDLAERLADRSVAGEDDCRSISPGLLSLLGAPHRPTFHRLSGPRLRRMPQLNLSSF